MSITSLFCLLLILLTSYGKSMTSLNPASILAEKPFPQANLLVQSKSPYLRQHMNNPVWWVPWGEEAFSWAREEDRPVFLSIGYSSCHWCHVMEGDSFDKSDIAKILNENFISIKVDRQERPDVDTIYMQAVRAMTGRGGWPLTLILTADKKPFFGATFIDHDRLKNILLDLVSWWSSEKRLDYLSQGEKLNSYLKNSFAGPKIDPKVSFDEKVLVKFYYQLKKRFDPEFGGFSSAPKFPPAMDLMALLRVHKRSQDKNILPLVYKTLDIMARSTLHDQLSGGFHRYATDRKWQIPHFEKMLYDNALLAMAYLEAFQVSRNEDYKIVAKKTLNFVLSEMTHTDGVFYSAYDADSEKTEGKYYLWSYKELKSYLTEVEFSKLREAYGLSKKGNFSSHISFVEEAAGLKSIKEVNVLSLIEQGPLATFEKGIYKKIKDKLLVVRNKRKKPLLDKNIITSWNALMIGALAKSYRVFGDKKYLLAAQKSMNYLIKEHIVSDRLVHDSLDKKKGSQSFLEDYAGVVWALTELYQSDFDYNWYSLAINLQERQFQVFWDSKIKLFFDTDGKDSTLLVRTRDVAENVTPTGNSLAALNLLRLGALSYNKKYTETGQSMLFSLAPSFKKSPLAFSFLLQAVDFFLDRSKEIAIVGNLDSSGTKQMLDTLRIPFNPNKVMACGMFDTEKNPMPLLKNKPLIKNKSGGAYICEKNICKLPTLDYKKASTMALQSKQYILD